MQLNSNFSTAEEAVEHLTRRRARIVPFIVAMYLALQVELGSKIAQTGTLDLERGIAWLLLSAVLLSAVSGSGLEGLMNPAWRPFLNDELTASHRLNARAFGFLGCMFAALVLLIGMIWTTLSGLQVVHMVVTFGIASAMLRFVQLERRAFA